MPTWPNKMDIKARGLVLPELQFNTHRAQGRIIAPDGTEGDWTSYQFPILCTDKKGQQWVAFTEYWEGEVKAYVVHMLVPVASKQSHKNYKRDMIKQQRQIQQAK